MKTGTELIAEERQRQISQEGWTPEHRAGEIALAATCYAMPTFVRLATPLGHTKKLLERLWPWSSESFKPSPLDRIRELTKAGALIAAEIDRLQRLQAPQPA